MSNYVLCPLVQYIFILAWILTEAALAKTIGGDHKKDVPFFFFSIFCAYFVV